MFQLPDRFYAKVDQSDYRGCWIWTGAISVGYGSFSFEGRTRNAHKLAYESLVGPVPPGMFLDHICHNRACVNPEHLRPVTNKQNQENQIGAQRHSKTGIRGVYWCKRRNRWRAEVRHNGRNNYVGLFSDLAEAERAVRDRRNELFTHNDADRVVTL